VSWLYLVDPEAPQSEFRMFSLWLTFSFTDSVAFTTHLPPLTFPWQLTPDEEEDERQEHYNAHQYDRRTPGSTVNLKFQCPTR
jgi:hypothetical protein